MFFLSPLLSPNYLWGERKKLMYFYLKEPKSKTKTLIYLIYHINESEGNFKKSTGLKIDPVDWNFETNLPVVKRGSPGATLKRITTKLNDRVKFLEKALDHYEIQGIEISKEQLIIDYDKEFNPNKVKAKDNSFKYFTDFIDDFVPRAPNLINRNTKRKHSPTKIKHYKKIGQRLKEYEQWSNNKIALNKFDLKLYDSIVLYLLDERKYSINYVGDIIKNIKALLSFADDELNTVHQDYQKKAFARISEESLSIALSEEEIEKVFNMVYERPALTNCRDLAIIGFWTGLRIGDLLSLPEINPDDEFIEVKPGKTSDTSGVKVVIPLHHHIKEMLIKRGMPYVISKPKFNEYIKEVCRDAGITQMVKGSLMNPETKRKETGLYPKYKLVSSHTCRRSFATNLYKMNFPTLSIMKITGHNSEETFLKYIKVTPKEHAEKLLQHWKNYYNQKKS